MPKKIYAQVAILDPLNIQPITLNNEKKPDIKNETVDKIENILKDKEE